MKTNNTWRYLAMAALLGVGACSSSRQTAQNAGEVDDLYGNSGDAVVSTGNERQTSARQDLRTARLDRRQQRLSNINPDYNEEQQSGVGGTNQQEYYSELSARNVQRGISADPGWNDVNSAYNSGYNNGYNNSLYGANSWNRWGLNNGGFYSGLGLGLGLGYGGFGGYGYSPFGFRLGYSPFGFGGYNAYAFGSPYGYGYDPFYSSYGYGGGYGGLGGGYGGYGGSYYGYRPTVVNNYYVTGADPYRSNRTSGARYSSASGRYNGDFNNTPRTGTDPGGRRSAGTYTGNNGYTNTTPAPSRGGDSYYSRPTDGGYNGSRSNTRGTYYYDNSGSTGGRTSGNSAPATQSYGNSSRGSSDTYYSAPSRGNYTPSQDASGSQNRSYSAPSYSAPSRSYSQPQQNYSQPSYSAPSRGSYSAPSAPSYSAPSYSAPSHSSGGGGGGGSSSGGGGGRGPR